VNVENLLGSILKGAVGSRQIRKSAGKAVKAGIKNPAVLIGVAGAAWGLYEVWKSKQGSAAPTSAAPSPTPSPTPMSPPPPLPPPIPTDVAAVAELPSEALRVIRLALSAARADGDLSSAEAQVILDEARRSGGEALVHDELQRSTPLSEIVAGVHDPQHKAQLYRLAFTIVHADTGVGGAERLYLAQLAHALGLDAQGASAIETEVTSRLAGN
jgi:uncharacterized membrane protein YebE (DUF533 family)